MTSSVAACFGKVECALRTRLRKLSSPDTNSLHHEVSETIGELRDLLEDTDPRWEMFGLNVPANPNPPVGVDEDFVNVADPHDLEYTLKNLTPGSTIEIYIEPMNDGGAGPASPTVSKVVGA